MTPLCVLFLHHEDNPGTRLHANQILKLNPQAEFVPLTFDKGMPWSIMPKDESTGLCITPLKKAENCDRLVWAWWRSDKRIMAERYIIIESDTLCLEPFEWFHRLVWDAPAAAGYVVEQEENPDWWWFKAMTPPVAHRKPLGVYPITGMLLSHDAMKNAANEVLDPWYNRLMSEARMGTALKTCGITPQTIRHDIREYLWWTPRHPSLNQRYGIWHAVKCWLPIHDRLK